jgi:diguanylate cyclase (GGDEF)-like protein/PAS domain S-box-containing protein
LAKHIGPQAYTAYAALRRRILAGEFELDGKLPPQSELAAHFGVALLTMRQALARLEQEGLVSSEQGRGTFARARLSATQKQAVVATQGQVLHMLACNCPLPDVLGYLCRSVEAMFPEMVCSILLVNKAGTCLQHAAAPSLPRTYTDAIAEVGIGPGAGSCGAAAHRREAVIARDIAADPLWAEFRDLALSHRLQACWSTPIFAAGGTVLGTFAIYYDTPRDPLPQHLELIQQVSQIAAIAVERTRAEERLRKSEGRLRALFENAAIGISLTDMEGRVVESNPALQRMIGYGEDELPGMHFSAFTHPDDAAIDWALFRELVAGERDSYELEKRYIRKDGAERWVRLTVSLTPQVSDEPGLAIAVVEDIHERKRAEAALEYQALHDALTNLPNRTLLLDRLKQAILNARRDNTSVALLLLDLDRFKEINDTFGHHHGDLLLQQLGPRLQAPLRHSDTVARLGGDEFALLLAATDVAGATRAARKVLTVLERPFLLDGTSCETGASIGLAVYPDHGEDADSLLRRADVAMYMAKRTEAGLAIYSPEQDQYSPGRLAMVAALREAIERDGLFLHYQPKIDLKTLRVASVEALARWHHPTYGRVAPDHFIHLAEQSGLIRPLSLWVLNEALRQCRLWHDRGLTIDLAWNLSARLLHDPQVVETIAQLLQRWEVEAQWLEVEITESALMVDADRALETLGQLRSMGVRIAIDDFGTGYSSLVFLRRLPVDTIKIDKSFIAGMADNPDDAIIVRSVLDLGHNLGLEVVAEGVESQHVLEVLTALRCDFAQGYLLARPVAEEELPSLLQKFQQRPVTPTR